MNHRFRRERKLEVKIYLRLKQEEDESSFPRARARKFGSDDLSSPKEKTRLNPRFRIRERARVMGGVNYYKIYLKFLYLSC